MYCFCYVNIISQTTGTGMRPDPNFKWHDSTFGTTLEVKQTQCWTSHIISVRFSTIRADYLICDTAVSSCIPGNEVRDQLLDPATVLGAEVFPRQPDIPVWTGPQHGEEGHEVTGPVHRKLCWRSCSTGDTGQQSEDKQLIQTAELDLIMCNNGTDRC